MNLFRKLFPKLNKLERAITSEIENNLSEANKLIFRDQINRINSVRRDPEGKETNFFWVKFGKVRRDFPKIFDVNEQEYKLATMDINYYGRVITVNVWLYNGRVFSFEYAKSIETVETRDNYTFENTNVYI